MTDKILIIDIDNSAHHVSRSGNLIAYGGVPFSLPPSVFSDAAKVPDYRNGLKRPESIMARVKDCGFYYEVRPDFTKIGRYGLCAYRDAQERRVVLAAFDGITNLRRHAIESGCNESEMPSASKHCQEESL